MDERTIVSTDEQVSVGAGGAIVAALNVSAPVFRVGGREEELCAAARAAAADLGAALANGGGELPAAAGAEGR